MRSHFTALYDILSETVTRLIQFFAPPANPEPAKWNSTLMTREEYETALFLFTIYCIKDSNSDFNLVRVLQMRFHVFPINAIMDNAVSAGYATKNTIPPLNYYHITSKGFAYLKAIDMNDFISIIEQQHPEIQDLAVAYGRAFKQQMQKKEEIRVQMIGAYLSALAGGADYDPYFEKYGHVNTNDEHEVKAMVREEFLPAFEKYPSDLKEQAKKSLRYALFTNEIDLQKVFDGDLLPFGSPADVKLFFKWIWEEFYGAESYSINNADDYVIVPDIYPFIL